MAKFGWPEWIALLNVILDLCSAILDLPFHLLMRLMGKQGLSHPQLQATMGLQSELSLQSDFQ